MKALPTLGGHNAQAFAINSQGQIIGVAENNTQDPDCPSPQVLDFEAAIWEPNGKIQELPPLPGDTVGFALRLNDKGQAVGSSGSCADTTYSGLVVGPHAVLWDHRSAINLGSLGGTLASTAAAINDHGEVVGGSDLASELPGFPAVQIHSFLLTRERGMQDIGTVGGDFTGLPTQINNNEQVVSGAAADLDKSAEKTRPVLSEAARQVIRQQLGRRYHVSGTR